MTNVELFDTLVSLYEHDISEYREVLLENGYELVYEDDVSSEEWETLDSFETFTDKLWEEKTMKNENITAEEYERIINEAMEEGMKRIEDVKKDWERSARKCRVSCLAARIGAAILTGGTSEIAYQLVVEPKLKEVLPTEFLW